MARKRCWWWKIPAGSAAEALQLSEREVIDLVLTDVVMPHINGRELADRLRAVQPGLKLLFMSGYTDNVIEYHGVREASGQLIQKPFTPEELARNYACCWGRQPRPLMNENGNSPFLGNVRR